MGHGRLGQALNFSDCNNGGRVSLNLFHKKTLPKRGIRKKHEKTM